MTLRSSKTDWLPASKLSLNIGGAKTYIFVFSSSLQLIWSITGMNVELKRHFPRNAAKNAWNRCDQIHFCQTSVPWGLYTFVISSCGSIMSLLAFHIYCFSPAVGILHPALIYNAIVIDLNFTIFLIFLPATFSRYSKLSYMPTSLLLEACSLMNVILDIVIFLSFLIKTLYETEMPRWLRRVIASIRASAEYRYIAIRRGI